MGSFLSKSSSSDTAPKKIHSHETSGTTSKRNTLQRSFSRLKEGTLKRSTSKANKKAEKAEQIQAAEAADAAAAASTSGVVSNAVTKEDISTCPNEVKVEDSINQIVAQTEAVSAPQGDIQQTESTAQQSIVLTDEIIKADKIGSDKADTEAIEGKDDATKSEELVHDVSAAQEDSDTSFVMLSSEAVPSVEAGALVIDTDKTKDQVIISETEKKTEPIKDVSVDAIQEFVHVQTEVAQQESEPVTDELKHDFHDDGIPDELGSHSQEAITEVHEYVAAQQEESHQQALPQHAILELQPEIQEHQEENFDQKEMHILTEPVPLSEAQESIEVQSDTGYSIELHDAEVHEHEEAIPDPDTQESLESQPEFHQISECPIETHDYQDNEKIETEMQMEEQKPIVKELSHHPDEALVEQEAIEYQHRINEVSEEKQCEKDSRQDHPAEQHPEEGQESQQQEMSHDGKPEEKQNVERDWRIECQKDQLEDQQYPEGEWRQDVQQDKPEEKQYVEGDWRIESQQDKLEDQQYPEGAWRQDVQQDKPEEKQYIEGDWRIESQQNQLEDQQYPEGEWRQDVQQDKPEEKQYLEGDWRIESQKDHGEHYPEGEWRQEIYEDKTEEKEYVEGEWRQDSQKDQPEDRQCPEGEWRQEYSEEKHIHEESHREQPEGEWRNESYQCQFESEKYPEGEWREEQLQHSHENLPDCQEKEVTQLENGDHGSKNSHEESASHNGVHYEDEGDKLISLKSTMQSEYQEKEHHLE